MTSLELKYGKTTKGKISVIVCGYSYYLKKENEDSTRYVCKEIGCSASITIENVTNKILRINDVRLKEIDDDEEKLLQSHEESVKHEKVEDIDVDVRDCLTRLKIRVQSDPRPVPELFQEEQSAFARKIGEVGIVAAKFPQFTEVQSGLYKNRSKIFPTLPKKVQDLILEGDYLMTEAGQRFLLSHATHRNTRQKNDETSVIYCSDIGLSILASSKWWFSDGTFDTAVDFQEDGFEQFYIIHGCYKNIVLPCVFALLTNKTKEIYRNLISELKDGAARIKLKLEPHYVMLDFEAAAIDAYLHHFINIEIKLCHFHFGQNVFKKIVETGFKKQYTDDVDLKCWVKQIIALALIPPEEVEDAFVELSLNAPEQYDLTAFLDYITINYIDPTTCLFPIKYCNHYNIIIIIMKIVLIITAKAITVKWINICILSPIYGSLF